MIILHFFYFYLHFRPYFSQLCLNLLDISIRWFFLWKYVQVNSDVWFLIKIRGILSKLRKSSGLHAVA